MEFIRDVSCARTKSSIKNKITFPRPQIEQIHRKGNNNVVMINILFIMLSHFTIIFVLFYDC